jgi:hypothetical protein|tara:strand:- start:116 stop:556 length:441 start_codon:yes stop_codon:yes gene_type:complete
MADRLYLNLRIASQVPNGSAKADAITKAVKLTSNDRRVMPIRSASNVKISRTASCMPAQISFIPRKSQLDRSNQLSSLTAAPEVLFLLENPACFKITLAPTAITAMAKNAINIVFILFSPYTMPAHRYSVNQVTLNARFAQVALIF